MPRCVRPAQFEPVTLRWLAWRDPETYPVLLDSAATGALGRFSILAAHPRGAFWRDSRGQLHVSGQIAPEAAQAAGFLDGLARLWGEVGTGNRDAADEVNAAADGRAGPFHGGWMVFLSYEIAAEVEPQLGWRPRSDAPTRGPPTAFALRIPAALIFDHQEQRAWLLAENETLLDELARASALPPPTADLASMGGTHSGSPLQALIEEPPELFLERVRAAIEYIAAGEIYQANLSRPWRGTLTAGVQPAALYERLRRANPAPFAAWVQFQDWQLLCSSPERLVRVQAGRVDTRPIAGTRPRSGEPGRQSAETAALLAHPKERAEHVMLIDLERNDLGRICRAGSVQVDEFMVIESYAHVHHIVSNVCGELASGIGPLQVLRAVFPGGTITGCPKFRCMQLIAELEGEARGAYTGALGFINHDGSLDFNILIRSLTLFDSQLEFRAGAGIVADSQPLAELGETRAKARGLVAALQGQSS